MAADGSVDDVKKFRYAVGQPMGALSSWAMLAMTHHLIVQYCYKVSFPLKPLKWFDGYELLGDDIVIFDGVVAAKYLEVMELLGVPINLSKSVVATSAVVEFAKVTLVDGVDVSALSFKQFLSSSSSLIGRVSMLDFFLRKGIGLNIFRKYTADMIRATKFTRGLLGPGYAAMLTILANKRVFTYSYLLGLLNNTKVPLQSWYGAILLAISEDRLFTVLRSYFIDECREFSLPLHRDVLRNKKEV
jgi:hypothetical protein